jgi:hypothetical protein
MTETNKARDLVATLRDALHQLELNLGCTRDGVEALCELRQREDLAMPGHPRNTSWGTNRCQTS